MHALGDVHDTPSSSAPPGGSGVGWIVQFVPFHLSASEPPTAMHALGDVHDTPWSAAAIVPGGWSAAAFVPGGSGVGWIVQFVPFHPSASVSGAATAVW
jgi:hypothetical protein